MGWRLENSDLFTCLRPISTKHNRWHKSPNQCRTSGYHVPSNYFRTSAVWLQLREGVDACFVVDRRQTFLPKSRVLRACWKSDEYKDEL